MPTFERHSGRGADRIAFEPVALIIAGWAGRERAAVDHHIAELAELGVPGPSRILRCPSWDEAAAVCEFALALQPAGVGYLAPIAR